MGIEKANTVFESTVSIGSVFFWGSNGAENVEIVDYH